jgi:hypothetical protein
MKMGLERLAGRRGPDPKRWRAPPGLSDWIQYVAIGLALGTAPWLISLMN